MKKIKKSVASRAIIASGLFIVLAFVNLSVAENKATIQDIKQEMKETAIAIKSYSAAQRDVAVKKAKATLTRLDARIERMQERLDDKTNKMDQSAREKGRATLRALRKQRNEVAEWYGSMKHSSSEAWQDMKSGFLKSYQVLQDAFSKAQDEF